MTDRSGMSKVREPIDGIRTWLERLLIWRVWERMLEIEFVDRSVALAGKAFVSFFPLVIVVAAFVPERTRASIISAVAARLGLRGDAFSLVQSSFASSDDIRRATGLFGLVLTIFHHNLERIIQCQNWEHSNIVYYCIHTHPLVAMGSWQSL